MPEKKTFDWMRQQLNGFMRAQIIAAAAPPRFFAAGDG